MEQRIIFSKTIYYLKDYKIFAPEVSRAKNYIFKNNLLLIKITKFLIPKLMEQKYTENNNKKLCSK